MNPLVILSGGKDALLARETFVTDIYIKVRLMKPTHDSLLLRVSCLRTHQTVFNKENSYHLYTSV